MDGLPPQYPADGIEVFDRASLYERLLDDDELVRELVDAFVDDTPTQIAALQEALAAGDLLKTERLAHRIKGAAANLSACRLQRAANTLERVAHEGNQDQMARLVNAVGDEFLRARDAMRASLSS